MKKFKYVINGISLVFLLALQACSNSSVQNKTTKPQILRVCMGSEPFSLHPAYGFDAFCQLLIRGLFEGLMRIGPDGETQPGLAESIMISEDKKTYTFTLKESVWSNGQPVVASDFVYAWKNIISRDSASTLADLMYVIKNAKAIKEKKLPLGTLGVEALSSKVLRIELEHPASYFLHLLSYLLLSPVCQQVDIENPQWHLQKGEAFICNGPFHLEVWDAGKLIFTKNPLYHDAKNVKLSEIHVYVIDDAHTTFMMFEKGEIDWAGAPFNKIPEEAIEMLMTKHRLTMHPIAGVHWLVCNTDRFPLNSVSIRKAFAYAINRKDITENFMVGNKSAFGMVPDMFSCLDPEIKAQDCDLERAYKYFQEGLQELGITKEEFPTLELSFAPPQKQIVQIIQEQLRKNLGIKVDLIGYDWNVCFQNYLKKQFQLGISGWIAFIPDPIYHLEPFRHREATSNWCSWENADYQRALDRADQSSKEAERRLFLKEAETILLDGMPVVPLYYQTYRFVKNENLQHAPLTELGELDLKWVSFDHPL